MIGDRLRMNPTILQQGAIREHQLLQCHAPAAAGLEIRMLTIAIVLEIFLTGQMQNHNDVEKRDPGKEKGKARAQGLTQFPLALGRDHMKHSSVIQMILEVSRGTIGAP